MELEPNNPEKRILVSITYTCEPPPEGDITGMGIEEQVSRRQRHPDAHSVVIEEVVVGDNAPIPLSTMYCFQHNRFFRFDGMSRIREL